MPENIPTVFVSSTCYDLRQIRTDLSQFIERELGYRAMLSDQNSFSIDPDVDTIENCRRRVEQDADILVLVIGGRYGSVDQDSSKSITNLEYLTARAFGVPVYAFIDSSITAIMPVWKKNKEGDFSGTVDNVQLFQFIKDIRSRDKVWTIPFATAQDITSALKIQFASLMMTGLDWRRKTLGRPTIEFDGLAGKSFRLALEKPKAWEYRLFGQVISDEVEAQRNLRREYDLGLAMGKGEHVADRETHAWFLQKMAELSSIISALDPLLGVANDAFGPAGMPGDVTKIVFASRQIGIVYKNALEWGISLRRAHIEDRWKIARETLAQTALCTIRPISEYGPTLLGQLDDAMLNPDPSNPKVIDSVLKLENFDSDVLSEQLQAAVLQGPSP